MSLSTLKELCMGSSIGECCIVIAALSMHIVIATLRLQVAPEPYVCTAVEEGQFPSVR